MNLIKIHWNVRYEDSSSAEVLQNTHSVLEKKDFKEEVNKEDR